jgi:hypothetical protein
MIVDRSSTFREYMQQVSNGEIILTAIRSGLCSFLYDLDVFNPKNPDIGFLQGTFLLRVSTCMYVYLKC